MFKRLVLLSVVFLSGCATSYTISNAERGVKIKGSHCDEIHHVMSGTSLNICKMYGEPGDVDGKHTENNLVWLGIDSVASLLADVVVLPYTVFKQLTAEPIEVRSGPG